METSGKLCPTMKRLTRRSQRTRIQTNTFMNNSSPDAVEDMSTARSSQWILNGQRGVSSLELQSIQTEGTLGDYGIQVQLHAASLNYRDIALAGVCWYTPSLLYRSSVFTRNHRLPSAGL